MSNRTTCAAHGQFEPRGGMQARVCCPRRAVVIGTNDLERLGGRMHALWSVELSCKRCPHVTPAARLWLAGGSLMCLGTPTNFRSHRPASQPAIRSARKPDRVLNDLPRPLPPGTSFRGTCSACAAAQGAVRSASTSDTLR